jgi:hypothetical protein
MKNALFITLATCFFATAFGQSPDTIIKPTFNSRLITDESIGDFELLTKYYTIENNISNQNSSVYLGDKPTLEEYVKFALTQPSYFFIVHKGADVKLEITFMQKKEGNVTTFSYMIVNPGTGKRLEVPSHVLGQISEGRMLELEKLRLDRSSKILDLPTGKVYSFNGVFYTIQLFDQVKVEMLGLVKPIMGGMESAKGE